MKKKHHIIFRSALALLLTLFLIGCSDNNDETEEKAYNESNHHSSNEDASQNTNDDNDDDETSSDNSGTDSKTNSEDSASSNKSESTNDETSNEEDEISENNQSDTDSEDNLSNFSSEEIEYARVWNQLGPNPDVEYIDVQHIPEGTLLNPEEDDIDVRYPEDVIQLRGDRIVDGVVTYSSNGDGTVNVYKTPYRWYGGLPRPDDADLDELKKDREEIINNTESVYIDTGNDEEIINLIGKLSIQ
ncbi:hypothetical protein [Oceanobacillus timonensis]|uniref:hypothetical protein n=1 Tax=Oceanobacillus timonensis TaxID=1926285 RepID=UPI0009B99C1C|nr:hypothetical protein [Oceanobacillus timonensis]